MVLAWSLYIHIEDNCFNTLNDFYYKNEDIYLNDSQAYLVAFLMKFNETIWAVGFQEKIISIFSRKRTM
jgi:hypothetical protein